MAIFAAGLAGAIGVSDPTVTVRVYNYAKVPTRTLGGAEREAASIFAAAGVQTVWLGCLNAEVESQAAPVPNDPARETKCEGGTTAATVDLRILLRPVPDSTAALPDMTFGFADGKSLASVYWERVQDLACGLDGDKRDAPVILGDVMAHELGHLLLGTNSHSLAGIMRAKWDPVFLRQALMGHELFLPEQSGLMRTTVLRRHTEITRP